MGVGFIYSVKINVALQSIPSRDASTLTGHRSSSINRFHPHFSMILLLSCSSEQFLSQRNWWLWFSLERFQTPYSPGRQSRDSYSSLRFCVSGFNNMLFFSQGQRTQPQTSSWKTTALVIFVAVNMCWTSPFPGCNMSPCCSSYLNLLFLCILAGSLNDGFWESSTHAEKWQVPKKGVRGKNANKKGHFLSFVYQKNASSIPVNCSINFEWGHFSICQ